MPRIKKWKRTGNQKLNIEAEWKSTESGLVDPDTEERHGDDLEVFLQVVEGIPREDTPKIMTDEGTGTNYRVRLVEQVGMETSEVPIESFSNKKDAMEFARSWAKDHPDMIADQPL